MMSPRGSVFGSAPWLSAISNTYGFDISAIVVVDDDRPVAGIAFAELDDLLGRRVISMPFCDYLDPIIDVDGHWNALTAPLLERDLPLSLRVLHAEAPRRDRRFEQVGEMAWHETNLDRDEDALSGSLHPTARRNIRTARRKGVTVRFGSELDDVRIIHELHRKTRKRKYRILAQPLSFFENIRTQFAPSGGIEIGLAEYEGRPIAASLNLVWGNVWYYKFGASLAEYLNLRPNELLAWESMVRARQLGCSTYNWGVSDFDQPGLIEYKRKFASDERNVAVLRRCPAGHSNATAVEVVRVFGEMTSLLTRDDIPDAVTDRAGEILYRYFT